MSNYFFEGSSNNNPHSGFKFNFGINFGAIDPREKEG
jgi:hypothetical protein